MKAFRLILVLFYFTILFFLGRSVTIIPFRLTLALVLGFISSFLSLINLEIGLMLLIFVVPFTQQLPIGFVGPFQGPIDIGTDDILIFFVIFSWLLFLIKSKKPFFPRSSLNWPVFAFFTAAMLSFIGADARFGEDAVLIEFMHLLKFFEYVAVYFIVITAINNIDQIKKFLLMFFMVVGFIVIVQFVSMLKWGGFTTYSVDYLKNMYGFYSNATMGAYYCFFLSMLLVLVLDMPASIGKLLLILFIAIFSLALFTTYARSAYLGIFVSILVIAIFKEKKFFIIILLFIVLSPILMRPVLGRITYTVHRDSAGMALDESSEIRLYLWRKSWGTFLNNPIFGTGFWSTRYTLGTEAHSQYLAILGETGIVGFSTFCWMFIAMFRNSIVLIKKANTYFLKNLGIGYLAGLSAILITCFFSETLEAFQIVGPLWFVTGLIVSANRLSSEKNEKIDIDAT